MGRRQNPLHHRIALPLDSIFTARDAGTDPEGRLEELLEKLALSMERQGLRQPLLVTNAEKISGAGQYRLVVGRKRFLAAIRLGWTEIPCVLLETGSFRAQVEVIDRLQQGRVDPWHLAAALLSLKDECRWTQAQLGMVIGRTRDFVANILAITRIFPEVKEAIQAHPNGSSLSARHLRFVGRAPPRRQLQIALHILENRVSTRNLEREGSGRRPNRQLIKVRALRKAGSPKGPKSTREWRNYYRQISTDLRRVDRRETEEMKRTESMITRARERQNVIRQEARLKRKALKKELRRAARRLALPPPL